MFTSGKPGFLSSEDLVLFACGLRRTKVQDDGGQLCLQRGLDNNTNTIVVTGLKPNGVAFGPANPVWDAAGACWKLTIPVADYVSGVWFFEISNTTEPSTLHEYIAVEWGGTFAQIYTNSLSAALDAGLAKTAAQSAAADAATAKNNAADAKTSADTAGTKADAAKTSADTAGTKADAAKASADTAGTKADAAKASADLALAQATTAATQSTNAAADALAAKNNAANAKTSADTAGTKADAAKASADTAGTKADAAKASADTAGTKADAAKASADLALAQATTAATQSTTAATQATTGATQATLARQAGINRLKVDLAARQQILYADDGTTPLRTWALKDENGDPTATRVFERGAPT